MATELEKVTAFLNESAEDEKEKKYVEEDSHEEDEMTEGEDETKEDDVVAEGDEDGEGNEEDEIVAEEDEEMTEMDDEDLEEMDDDDDLLSVEHSYEEDEEMTEMDDEDLEEMEDEKMSEDDCSKDKDLEEMDDEDLEEMEDEKMSEDDDSDEEKETVSLEEKKKIAQKRKLQENAKRRIKRKAMKESVKALFKDVKGVKPEFIEKATVIFEAAVTDRVGAEKKNLARQYNRKLKQAYAQLDESVSKYADYAAKEFLKENKLAIESGSKVQLAEELIKNSVALFEQAGIKITLDGNKVIKEQRREITKLKRKVNEGVDTNIKLQDVAKKAIRENIVESVSKDLTTSQKEKLLSLTENVEFKSKKQFKQAALSVRNKFITESKTAKTRKKTITENVNASGNKDVEMYRKAGKLINEES